MMEYEINGKKLVLKKGDITEEETDVIVNAANSTLMGGGGVDGAIHRKGGKQILEECKEIRRTQYPSGLPTGKAVITTGGNLKAKYVIHTVGPICLGNSLDEKKTELLKNAYANSFKLADGKGLKSIAFPSISTGAYGCPLEKSSEIAIKTILELLPNSKNIEKVVFVLFTPEVYNIYKNNTDRLLESKT